VEPVAPTPHGDDGDRHGRDGGKVPRPPVAAPDDTALEVAALLARVRSPLVAVAERDKQGTHLLGVITASHLLERLLAVGA
jgi:CBS domain-containing protein